MKIRIVTFAFAMCAFFVIGCAGTPVAVDRYGNVQPSVQIYQPPRNSTVTEFEVRPFDLKPNEAGSSIFGFNSLQIKQVPMTFDLPSMDSSTTLFNFKGYWTKQMPMTFNLPYNQDWSLTLFNFDNFRVKLMPMFDGRY